MSKDQLFGVERVCVEQDDRTSAMSERGVVPHVIRLPGQEVLKHIGLKTTFRLDPGISEGVGWLERPHLTGSLDL